MLHTIYFQNIEAAQSLYDSKIFLGTDKSYLSSSLTECYSLINDSGFFLMLPLCKSLPTSHIAVRRESLVEVGRGNFSLNVGELRPF